MDGFHIAADIGKLVTDRVDALLLNIRVPKSTVDALESMYALGQIATHVLEALEASEGAEVEAP